MSQIQYEKTTPPHDSPEGIRLIEIERQKAITMVHYIVESLLDHTEQYSPNYNMGIKLEDIRARIHIRLTPPDEDVPGAYLFIEYRELLAGREVQGKKDLPLIVTGIHSIGPDGSLIFLMREREDHLRPPTLLRRPAERERPIRLDDLLFFNELLRDTSHVFGVIDWSKSLSKKKDPLRIFKNPQLEL